MASLNLNSGFAPVSDGTLRSYLTEIQMNIERLERLNKRLEYLRHSLQPYASATEFSSKEAPQAGANGLLEDILNTSADSARIASLMDSNITAIEQIVGLNT